ncbi:hypothetical protein, partial [Acinetobacter baumannii]|uniref:hypothetical protein n=1 Tax=Acinetobacter baumannii TaxID=470 RepID=UPI0028A1CA56
PELGLYQLSWEKGAFTTTKGGDVSADDKLFVAGSVATVVLPGFEIGSTKQVTSLGVDHSGQGNVNTAYYSSPSVEARLNTGDGQDY